MKDRDQFARLSKLQESGDNEECWKVFYTEDVVRRITGLEPLVSRDACQRQEIDFVDETKTVGQLSGQSAGVPS